MQQSKRIIISGGGTGGHIFPAIAIANAIKKADPNTEFLFVGAKDRMEMEKVPAAGYKIVGLWISGFQRSLSIRNLLFPLKVVVSMIQAYLVIKKFKPDVAVGVGGYASGPLLRAASFKKIPTLIQEQNSFPGVTNKILATKVNQICVAYEGLEKYFPKEKIIVTGNPVRNEILSLVDKHEDSFKYFNLSSDKKTILVVGGSLGARSINQAVEKNLKWFVENKIQLIWQTGKTYFEKAKSAVTEDMNEYVRVYDFITKMDLAYSVCDIVISRAGAIAISELCCVAKPVILVPSPWVAEDHQTKNANALVEKQAAIMVKDSEADSGIIKELDRLISDLQMCKQLSENIEKMAYKNAADEIAKEVLQLIKQK